MSRCFVPKDACTVASGDCFVQGRCLGGCRSRPITSEDYDKMKKRIEKLERALAAANGERE